MLLKTSGFLSASYITIVLSTVLRKKIRTPFNITSADVLQQFSAPKQIFTPNLKKNIHNKNDHSLLQCFVWLNFLVFFSFPLLNNVSVT